MPNEKVVRLLQVKVLPQYRDEVLQAVRENKLPTRADKGVEAYYQAARRARHASLLRRLFLTSCIRFPYPTRTCQKDLRSVSRQACAGGGSYRVGRA